MDPSEPSAVPTPRRRFLARLSVGLSGLIATATTVPVIGFLLSPLTRKPPRVWRPVGPVEQYPPAVGRPDRIVDPHVRILEREHPPRRGPVHRMDPERPVAANVHEHRLVG